MTDQNMKADLDSFYTRHKPTCHKSLKMLGTHIPSNSVCFDIGSNLGMYSESLLELHPDAFVHLFEPIKDYCAYSERKLEKYKDRIKINNLGLSNKIESKTIYVCPSKNKGWNTFIGEKANPNMPAQEVPVTTLDHYWSEASLSHVDFIKIDTEGYEAFIIDGFFNTLRNLNRKPVFVIELGWGSSHPYWDYSLDISKKLFSLGYTSNRNIKDLKSTCDVIFTPF